MHRALTFSIAVSLASGLCLLSVETVMAHGEVDEALLEEFQNHLDDYRSDVERLLAEVQPIVEGHAAGEDVTGAVDELIHEWEDVDVHAAIESKATVTYPGIWQALVSLQQAVGDDKPAEEVAKAGDAVAAALWQGMGAVRLAASQVGSGTATAARTEPASGAETVEHIIADLDRAVAAYQDDELAQAEALIHETYMSRFEGLEGTLIEHDPDLVSSLERDFNATLPLLMQQGASMDQVRAQLDSMKTHLRDAGDILEQAEASRSEVF